MQLLKLNKVEELDLSLSDLNDMAKGSLQSLSAGILIAELMRNEVRDFILSPGARAIPLVLALNYFQTRFSKNSNLYPNVILVNDERSAAFMAQGISKSGRLPCLICTSGTAVANYLPGVVEAFYSKTPMLIISTDRPWELHNASANQTIKQKNIFNDFSSFQIDMPALEVELRTHSFLANINQLIFSAIENQSPVHLNIAYRKPFYDADFLIERDLPVNDQDILNQWWLQDKSYISRAKFDNTYLEKNFNIFTSKDQIMIISGPLSDQEMSKKLILKSSQKNIPILADIHSNLRQLKSKNVFSLFNSYIEELDEDMYIPKIVFFIGDRMISDTVHKFLNKHNIRLIQVTDSWQRGDGIENEFICIEQIISYSSFFSLLEKAPALHTDFLNNYSNLEDNIKDKILNTFVKEDKSERNIICSALRNVPEESHVFLSNSLIFREADNFAYDIPLKTKLFGNRGATGIDGIIASALGTIAGNDNPLLCILGDQAAFHDLTSLGLVRNFKNPMLFIIINNGGGAIFNLMKKEELANTLINPHERSFEKLVEGFGLRYFLSQNVEELVDLEKEVFANGMQVVIEIRTDGIESVEKLTKI